MLTTVWLVRGELKLATLEMTHSNRRTHPGAHPRQVVNHSPTGHGRTIQPPNTCDDATRQLPTERGRPPIARVAASGRRQRQRRS